MQPFLTWPCSKTDEAVSFVLVPCCHLTKLFLVCSSVFPAGSYLLGFLLLIALEFSFVGSGLSFVNQFERAGMRQAFVICWFVWNTTHSRVLTVSESENKPTLVNRLIQIDFYFHRFMMI